MFTPPLRPGWGVLNGQTWARITGIFFAFINLVALFPIFGVYPLWNLLVATLLIPGHLRARRPRR